MPTERLSMRKIRDVLRLKFESGLSERVIGRAMSLSNGSVNSYLQRARMAGLGWPLPDGLDDAALERLLFPPAAAPDAAGARARPEWAALDKEMRRKGVTLALLWEEYRAAHPDGFGYSWFCEQYGAFKSRLRPSMRQSHAAGEKVFVDFAGDTIDVIDPSTGEVRPMKLFVAAMGASSYIFAQARPSEQIADWIGAHVDLLAFLGGAPKFVVCDNLKAAVTNPDRYEPGLNRGFWSSPTTTAWRSCGAALQTARQGQGRAVGPDAESADDESFSDNLLEYPHYTRPAEWQGRRVPDVLLSGHHAEVAAWRRREAERITRERRPDLWAAHLAAMQAGAIATPRAAP